MPITKNEIKDKTNELSQYWFAGPKDWKLIAVEFGLLSFVLVIYYIIFGENINEIQGTLLLLASFVLSTIYGLQNKLPEKTIYNSNFTFGAILSVLGLIISLSEGGVVAFAGGIIGLYISVKIASWLGKKIHRIVYNEKITKWLNKQPQIHKMPLVTFITLLIVTLFLLSKIGLINRDITLIAIPLQLLFGIIVMALYKYRPSTLLGQIGYGILLSVLGIIFFFVLFAAIYYSQPIN